MKKGLSRLVLFALSFLILLAPSAFGTLTFFTQLDDSGTALHSIYPISATTLTMCGTLGVVARSTDRGVTWTSTLMPAGSTDYTWYRTRFSSASRGFIVGKKGTAAYIYRSTDGGSTWSQNYTTSDSPAFYGMYFKDENTGWIGAFRSAAQPRKGRVYRTADGGDSWTGANTPTDDKNMYSVGGFSRDGTDCLYTMGDSGYIHRSFDGGVTFTTRESGTSNILLDVYFPSNTVGWAVGGNGTILKCSVVSSPQGINETWAAQTSGTTANLYCVYFLDNNTGWAGGTSGTLLYTNDAGANWTVISTGTTDLLYDIRAYDSDNIWVVGGGSRVILKGGTGSFQSVDPGSVVVNVAKKVTITGNFPLTGTYTVAIPGETATSVTRVSATQLTFNITPTTAGVKTISITCPDNQPITATDALTVTSAQGGSAVSDISPSYVNVGERKNITITGSGFQTGATVSFGSGYTIHGTIVNDSTKITVDVTFNTAGIRSVTAINPDGILGVKGNSLLVIDPNASNPSPTSVIPGYAYRDTAFQAAIGGTGLSSVNNILIPGIGVTISIVNTSDTLIRANVVVDSSATVGTRDIILMSPTGGAVLPNGLEIKSAVTSGKVVTNFELGPQPIKGGATVLNIQGEAQKGNITIEFPVFGSNGAMFARPSIYVAQPGRFSKPWYFKTDRIQPIPNGIHVMKVIAEGAVQASKKVVFYQY